MGMVRTVAAGLAVLACLPAAAQDPSGAAATPTVHAGAYDCRTEHLVGLLAGTDGERLAGRFALPEAEAAFAMTIERLDGEAKSVACYIGLPPALATACDDPGRVLFRLELPDRDGLHPPGGALFAAPEGPRDGAPRFFGLDFAWVHLRPAGNGLAYTMALVGEPEGRLEAGGLDHYLEAGRCMRRG